MKSSGTLVEDYVSYPNGNSGSIFRKGPKAVIPTFEATDLAILSFVTEKYSGVNLDELLSEIVYQTEPMLDAIAAGPRGNALGFERVDDTKSNELGLGLEELLSRSADLRSGRYISHRDAMTQLSVLQHGT